MTNAFQLTEAGNTWNPALETLHRRGYRLWVELDDADDEAATVRCAQKDSHRFNAFGPVALLGLVALWEQFGDDWGDRVSSRNWYEDLFSTATSELEP
jgi:hypothetical protein